MGLETASYLTGLNPLNPVVGDFVSQGDDHIRLIKSALQNTFPNHSGAQNYPTSFMNALLLSANNRELKAALNEGSVLNVLDYGATPGADCAVAINTAIAAANVSGNVIIDIPFSASSYEIHSPLTAITKDNVYVRLNGTLAFYSSTASQTMLQWTGVGSLGSYTLTSNVVIGSPTIVLSSVSGLSTGDLLGFTNTFQSGHSAQFFAATIASISSLTVTLDKPVPFVIYVTNPPGMAYSVQKLSMLNGGGLIGTGCIDGTNATAHNTKGVLVQYTMNQVYDGVRFTKWYGDTIAVDATNFSTGFIATTAGYNNQFTNLDFYKASGGGLASANFWYQSGGLIDNINTSAGSYIGVGLYYSSEVTIGRLRSNGHVGRNTKINHCVNCTLDSSINTGASDVNFVLSGLSFNNNFGKIVCQTTGLSGATPGNRLNVWIAATDDVPVTITGATAANPVVITSAGHKLQTGMPVQIASVGGMTQLNGNSYLITVLSSSTFSLQDKNGTNIDGSGFSAYTTGGTASWVLIPTNNVFGTIVAVDASNTSTDADIYIDPLANGNIITTVHSTQSGSGGFYNPNSTTAILFQDLLLTIPAAVFGAVSINNTGNAALTLSSGASSTSYISFQRNSVEKWELGVNVGGFGDDFGLYSGAAAALAARVESTTTYWRLPARLGIGSTSIAPLYALHLTGGGQTSLQAVAGIYANPNSTDVQITAETSAGIEGGILASSAGSIYGGSWSNHPYIVRTNNLDAVTISTSQVMSLAHALAVTSGGTGLSAATQGDILYASTTNTLVALAKDTNATRYLANTGTSNNPAWAQVSLTTGVSGVLPLANGGSNANLTASNGGILWSNASQFQILSGTSTASFPLLSGSTAAPTWATITYPGSATSGGIPYFSSTTAITSSALLAANAIVVGGGAGTAPTTPGTTPPTITSAGIVAIPNATNATSFATGALIVTGGVSISKTLLVGGGSGTINSTPTPDLCVQSVNSTLEINLGVQSLSAFAFLGSDGQTYFLFDINRRTATGVFQNTSATHSRFLLNSGNGSGSIAFYTTNTNNSTAPQVFTIFGSGGVAINTSSDPGAGMFYTNSASFMARTKTSWNTGASPGHAGTMTNAPAVGDPTKWIPVDDNGTTRYLPAW